MNASMTRGFFPLSPPRVFFLRCMTFLLLVVFLPGSSNQSSSPVWDVFSLEVVVDGVAALFSHICCVVHLEKLNTFFAVFIPKTSQQSRAGK